MKKIGIGIMASMIGAVLGIVGSNYMMNKKLTEKEGKVEKFKGYYNLLNQWLINKNDGKKVEQYFVKHGYKSIAIYGMGELGNRLYEELRDSDIEIKYAIDKNANNTYSELTVLDLEDDVDVVDVIVITAFFALDEIEDEIREKVDFQMISIEDVIYE